jgi:predicted enzyme related to lactoylglutathione lyase
MFVSDLQPAVEFYHGTLGLELTAQDKSSYAVFQLTNITLVVERVDPADAEFSELVGRFTGVSFSTADIHAAYNRLSSAGVHFIGKPERQVWGGMLAHFHDPDHNVLTLVEAPSA